ncbi:MAG: cupin domain-containing protein [Candidatus Eremiobacteraeota bacterium]|nr:cupin domain-containing protein [Candidatus Eremiobacteraeota bacterium]
MSELLNIDNIAKEHIKDPDFKSKKKTLFLGDAAGAENIFVNIDYIKHGGKSKKYHSHTKQEEFFFIMKGKGILRLNEKEISVREGDFVAKPAGKGIAHQFINNGKDILQIMDFGLREEDDIESYPDEDIILLKKHGMIFRPGDGIVNWDSDPNEE